MSGVCRNWIRKIRKRNHDQKKQPEYVDGPEDDGRGNAAACGKPCAEKEERQLAQRRCIDEDACVQKRLVEGVGARERTGGIYSAGNSR